MDPKQKDINIHASKQTKTHQLYVTGEIRTYVTAAEKQKYQHQAA
jgi:hypothetical protein